MKEKLKKNYVWVENLLYPSKYFTHKNTICRFPLAFHSGHNIHNTQITIRSCGVGMTLSSDNLSHNGTVHCNLLSAKRLECMTYVCQSTYVLYHGVCFPFPNAPHTWCEIWLSQDLVRPVSVFKAMVSHGHSSDCGKHSILAIIYSKMAFVSSFDLSSALVALPNSVRC